MNPKLLILTSPLLLIALTACNATTPGKLLPIAKQAQNNKTAQLLSEKRLTSSITITRMDAKLYNAWQNWCQYSDTLNPDMHIKMRSGLCYSQTNYTGTQHLREFTRGDGNYLKFPRASNVELEKLKQDLVQMDFASIQSMPGKPDMNKGYWSALFCYEDPAKPKERAKCMEATNPLTHPKTDAVMRMLQRFARGNSMDPR